MSNLLGVELGSEPNDFGEAPALDASVVDTRYV
jgi:hypothetical protein